MLRVSWRLRVFEVLRLGDGPRTSSGPAVLRQKPDSDRVSADRILSTHERGVAMKNSSLAVKVMVAVAAVALGAFSFTRNPQREAASAATKSVPMTQRGLAL